MYKVKRFGLLPKSFRGYGRSLLLGGLASAATVGSTVPDLNKDIEEGASPQDAIKNSKRRGWKRGALIGGLIGAIKGGFTGLSYGGLGGALAGSVIGAGGGAIGTGLVSRWGAGKNAKSRLKKAGMLYSDGFTKKVR